MSKTHKTIVLKEHMVVDKKDCSIGDKVTLENNDANLLLAMNRACMADSDEAKEVLKAVKEASKSA